MLPAWTAGDIARNLGMALGLAGPLSIVPLLVVALALTTLILVVPGRRAAHQSTAVGLTGTLQKEDMV